MEAGHAVKNRMIIWIDNLNFGNHISKIINRNSAGIQIVYRPSPRRPPITTSKAVIPTGYFIADYADL
jgi:hypothetical protein